MCTFHICSWALSISITLSWQGSHNHPSLQNSISFNSSTTIASNIFRTISLAKSMQKSFVINVINLDNYKCKKNLLPIMASGMQMMTQNLEEYSMSAPTWKTMALHLAPSRVLFSHLALGFCLSPQMVRNGKNKVTDWIFLHCYQPPPTR